MQASVVCSHARTSGALARPAIPRMHPQKSACLIASSGKASSSRTHLVVWAYTSTYTTSAIRSPSGVSGVQQGTLLPIVADYETPPDVGVAPLLLQSWTCPYVQRVVLALAHKKASVRAVTINLGSPPQWLRKFSPHGKVPAVTYLEDGKQRILYESIPLVFWVDEYFSTGPSLLPASPADRALARIIINRFDQKFVPTLYQLLALNDVYRFKVHLDAVRDELTWLEDATVGEHRGPFLLGKQPTVADAVIAPWLLRNVLFQHYRHVDLLAKHRKLAAYLENYKNVPEVQASLRTPSGTGYDQWSRDIVALSARYAGDVENFSALDN